VGDTEVADAIARSPQFQQDARSASITTSAWSRTATDERQALREAYRRDLLRGKVVQAADRRASVSDDEVKAAYTAQHESAAITWVRFNPFMFRDAATATDAEAEEYMKARGEEIRKKYEDEKVTRWTHRRR